MTSLPPLISRDEAARRLELVFPRDAYDTALSGPSASAAVTAMIYVGAVVDDAAELDGTSPVVRPTTCLWMQPEVLEQRVSDDDRHAWARASRGKKTLEALVTSWGIPFHPWYGDNSRETLRDEALHGLRKFGAVRQRGDIPTTSSAPRWALARDFAHLFDTALDGDDLQAGVEAWRDSHLSAGEQLRIRSRQSRMVLAYQVTVKLPDGRSHRLAPGLASLLLRGVVEAWAPARLREPVVLMISEPGAKMPLTEAAELDTLGIRVDVSDLLPDALLADVGVYPVRFWVVEAVATDGPVTEERRQDLIEWAGRQNLDPTHLEFLSVFPSRADPTIRRRLKDLGYNTHAWFLDEPDYELVWRELPTHHLASVTPIRPI